VVERDRVALMLVTCLALASWQSLNRHDQLQPAVLAAFMLCILITIRA
jgi:hypothetical protein